MKPASMNVQQVRDSERLRIARDIHDDLGQSLLALKLELSALGSGMDGAVGEQLGQMVRSVDATILSLRSIIHDLRTPMLDAGLAAAVERQVAEFERVTGIAPRLRMGEGLAHASPAAQMVAYRCLQELLANVARHARASEVSVELELGTCLLLRVRDNGIGMQASRPGACGLRGLRERVAAANGRLTIDSGAGRGTCIVVAVPALPSLPA